MTLSGGKILRIEEYSQEDHKTLFQLVCWLRFGTCEPDDFNSVWHSKSRISLILGLEGDHLRSILD
jgi:hypothetical protein